MKQSEKLQTLEALLATLIIYAGGEITLPIDEVLRSRRRYTFYAEGDAEEGLITVGVRALRLKLFRPSAGQRRKRSPPGQRHNKDE